MGSRGSTSLTGGRHELDMSTGQTGHVHWTDWTCPLDRQPLSIEAVLSSCPVHAEGKLSSNGMKARTFRRVGRSRSAWLGRAWPDLAAAAVVAVAAFLCARLLALWWLT